MVFQRTITTLFYNILQIQMLKTSLINADDAIKSFIKYSSLSQGIYQGLVSKPQEIAKLIRIAVDPQREGITQTHLSLVACQIFQNYPYLLLVLFSLEGNANCLFDFIGQNPNPTQLGYFSKLVSLFNPTTQEQALKYLKDNQNVLSLCFNHISIPAVFRFLFDCTVLCKKEYQIRSIILIKLYKQIIIEPCQELAQSIKDTLTEMIQNYNVMGQTIKQTICNIFNEEYIKEIVDLVKKCEDKYVSEICVSILNKIVLIYFMIKKQITATSIDNSKRESGRKQIDKLKERQGDKEPEKNENQQKDKKVASYHINMSYIENGMTQFLKSLNSLSSLLNSHPKQTHIDQTNQTVSNITPIKLKLSQLFKSVVKNFSMEQMSTYKFNLVDLFKTIIEQINVNPWANLVHNELTEIALLIIDRDPDWGSAIFEIIEELMGLFKNRYYIFLNSGKTIFQGHTHHLYLIIKKLSNQLDRQQLLESIFANCKPWKKFLTTDLHRYQDIIKPNADLQMKEDEEFAEATIGSLIIKINERNSNHLINQFINDLNDSYVVVKDYTVWDKKKEAQE